MTNTDPIVIEAPVQNKSEAARNAYEDVQYTKTQIRAIQKQMREVLLKNGDYAQFKDEALEANRELRFEKNKLMRQPEYRALEEKVKQLKDGLKNKQLTLFTELDKYTSETGQYILPLEDERKVIEREYKLKKF